MIILLATITTSLVAYTDSAAMFPFTFRIPNQNQSKDGSSLVMVPAAGPLSSDAQILRSIFDGFSFWAGTQAVKLDPLGDSLSTSVTSSLISTVPVGSAEKPAEQAADEMKPSEAMVTETEEAKPDSGVPSDEATPAETTAVSDEAKPAETIAASDEAKPEAPVVAEEPLPAPTVEAPAAVADAEQTSEPLPVVADVSEPVAQPSEPMGLASDPMELPVEQSDPAVTESAMDAVVINAVELQMSDVSEVRSELIEFSARPASLQRQTGPDTPSNSGNITTPYSPTCAYIPDASFIGFTLYALINIGSPFQCGNRHCAADWQCTHWNWTPANNGTCEIKSAPGTGWMWATPTTYPPPPAPAPTSSNWCGFIPKRTCPPALISICIYIDIILTIL